MSATITPNKFDGTQEVEQVDDSVLQLVVVAVAGSGGRECLANDGFADVADDEERNSEAKRAVPLLKELLEDKDNKSGGAELDNKEKADVGADITRLTNKDL